MKYNIVKTSKVVKTPAYVQHIYGKLYENETVSRFFDDERIVSLVTCFQQYKMIDDVVKEISKIKKQYSIPITQEHRMDSIVSSAIKQNDEEDLSIPQDFIKNLLCVIFDETMKIELEE